MKTSSKFRVHVRGPLACFTRPEMKVERMSYDVMTPSAARGVLEAVLWKPAVQWLVEDITVLRSIRWTSFRRNEVNSRASPKMDAYFADEDRAQRNTVALADVEYVIGARFVMTEKAGPDDSVPKFEAMFTRRLENGQCFHQPYLGCREMAADVRAAPATVSIPPELASVRRPLGLMFYDFDFSKQPVSPLFFDAHLERGVLNVPSPEQVRRDNGAP
jgi:CRISPR-associated protein Cas5d